MLLEVVLPALLFILPAYVANATPVIVKGKHPIDSGKNFIDGKRIFGDGKTFEGFISGILAGIASGIIVGHVIQLSLTLSLGALLGDLLGAFIKRRLGLRRGAPAPGLDQLDFIVGALALSSVIYIPSVDIIATILLVTPPLHVLTNRLAYMLKLKDTPW